MNGSSLPENSYGEFVASVRQAYKSGKTRPVSFRVQQLKNMVQMITENKNEFLQALYKDLRKHTMEAALYELDVPLYELNVQIKNCAKWAQDVKLRLNLLDPVDSAFIRKEPYGVVLVLGAWNYKIVLTLQPALGAICAGNCVIIKPSELAPSSAHLLADLIPKYLDNDCYRVVLADIQGTNGLLTNKFDHIFCTGSIIVGRAVMTAATANLTPVTLELGGKSPCYVDDFADMEIVVKRILWGKLINLGQTCIAPDYILCSKQVQQAFLDIAPTVLKKWHGEDLQNSSYFPRIINQRHYKRLCNLLENTQGKIVLGGKMDENDLWIEPTCVIDLPLDDILLQDEIFGPILPMITVKSQQEAIDYINSRSQPLALYTFSNNTDVNKQFIEATSSGGVCVNDTICHAAFPGLPFGGVGNSGMGNYHGKYSFDTFSRQRSVLARPLNKLSEYMSEVRYPPYTMKKLKLLQLVSKTFDYFNWTGEIYVKYLLAALLGVVIYVCVTNFILLF